MSISAGYAQGSKKMLVFAVLLDRSGSRRSADVNTPSPFSRCFNRDEEGASAE